MCPPRDAAQHRDRESRIGSLFSTIWHVLCIPVGDKVILDRGMLVARDVLPPTSEVLAQDANQTKAMRLSA